MHLFTVFTVFAAVSLATFIVPRITQPDNWSSALEPWKTYHARYLSLGCEEDRVSNFFISCCHPLMKTQTAADLPSQCRPGGNDAADDGDVDNGDDGDDCDDDGDETTTVPSHTSIKPTPVSTKHASSHTTMFATETTAGTTTDFIAGGIITYFYQNGVAGACGTVHKDTDIICALETVRYAKGHFCGREIMIVADNGKNVTAKVADECPTCNNSNCIDLSVAAFEEIAPTSIGQLPMTWTMLPQP